MVGKNEWGEDSVEGVRKVRGERQVPASQRWKKRGLLDWGAKGTSKQRQPWGRTQLVGLDIPRICATGCGKEKIGKRSSKGSWI